MQTNSDGYLITREGWYSRLMFALSCAFVAALIMPLFILMWNPFWGFIIGFDLWIIGVTMAMPYFFVAVPEATGLITVMQLFLRPTEEDSFRNYRVFPTGFHPRFPWEKITTYIDLRAVVVAIQEDIPAKDGVLLVLKMALRYIPMPPWLPVYIAVNKVTIETTIANVATSKMLTLVGEAQTAEEARGKKHDYETSLVATVDTVKAQERFDRILGIDVVDSRITDIGFDAQITTALNNRAITKIVRESANALVGGDVTAKDAMDAALVIAGKATLSNVGVVGIKDITGALREIGLALAAAISNRNQSNR